MAESINQPGMPQESRLSNRPNEDALEYLRCSNISEYRKGHNIYDPDQPCTNLYLVIDGMVKVSRIAENGHEVLIDIYLVDEFFGEAAFVGVHTPERAVALQDTKVMFWPAPQIEADIMRQPRLGVALIQMAALRSVNHLNRLASLATDSMARRLARSLIRFSERLALGQEDGRTLMPPLSHALLAQYIGTSREIVTHQMNQFRRNGYLRYSRRAIVLDRAALTGWLNGAGAAEGPPPDDHTIGSAGAL